MSNQNKIDVEQFSVETLRTAKIMRSEIKKANAFVARTSDSLEQFSAVRNEQNETISITNASSTRTHTVQSDTLADFALAIDVLDVVEIFKSAQTVQASRDELKRANARKRIVRLNAKIDELSAKIDELQSFIDSE